jgi:hypothetical protein
MAAFSWNFNRIVNRSEFLNNTIVLNKTISRYENTIAGQFYGHVHSEELMVFYDEVNKTRPVSMVYSFHASSYFYFAYHRLILDHQ